MGERIGISFSFGAPKEQSPQKDPEQQAKLTKEAGAMFIRVSQKQPGSVLKQAAEIALELRGQEQQIFDDLSDALVNDEEQVNRIVTIANAVHERTKKRKDIKIHRITPRNARGTIRGDFEWARTISVLPEEELRGLLRYEPTGFNFLAETKRRMYAKRLIKTHKQPQRRAA